MFVRSAIVGAALATMFIGGGSAMAADAAKGGVPLVLTVTDVRIVDAPLYISVQTKADYRSMKGSGVIVRSPDTSSLTRTINVPREGRYAVSLWHDLDNDGRFSMNERYEIEDGWGMSGVMPNGAPSFEDAAIDIPSQGANATARVVYPNG